MFKTIIPIFSVFICACSADVSEQNSSTLGDQPVITGEKAAPLPLYSSNIVTDSIAVPEGLLLSSDSEGAVLLSGFSVNPFSYGETSGISFPVTPEFERLVSGGSVEVSVTAKVYGGAGPQNFSVAYSTNDNGNSGWQGFIASSEPEEFSFVYNVSSMVNGGGDFVGILPDTFQRGGKIELISLTISKLY